MGVDFALERGQLAPQPADLFGDLGGIARGAVLGVLCLQLREACFHLVDRGLERAVAVQTDCGTGGILGHALASRIGV